MTYSHGPELKGSSRAVVFGTVLGGSSIIKPTHGKNCYLSMRNADKEWLSYKVNELKELFKIDDRVIIRSGGTYRTNSIAYPAFNEVYALFYEEGRKFIREEVLESLNDMAWAIWLWDAGKKVRDKIYLRTNKFGEDGTRKIVNYFNSLDCDCSVAERRGFQYVLFSKTGTYKLLKVVAKRFPNVLIHKFHVQ